MIYDVTHITTFNYAQSVSISQQVLRLKPRSFDQQSVLSFELDIKPRRGPVESWQDYFGNDVVEVLVEKPHRSLEIAARSRIDVTREQRVMLELSPRWETVAEALRAPRSAAALEASQFCFASPYIDEQFVAWEYAQASLTPGRPLLDAVMDLTSRVHADFTYQGGVTDVHTPVAEVFEQRAGVCQDFAHLQIACLRAHGIAARYISGYLLTHPPEGRERLVGADASHAWLSVWCPEFGWVDFDPTNDVMPEYEHITVGWGRDYGDVSPVMGFIVGGGSHDVLVSVDVAPVATS